MIEYLATYCSGGAGPKITVAKECLAGVLFDVWWIVVPHKGGDDNMQS